MYNLYVCIISIVHAQSCPTLCDPMDCRLPGSSVPGIFQARILEWVAITCSRGRTWPRDQTRVSCVSCIERWILYHCTTWEGIWSHHFIGNRRLKSGRVTGFIFLGSKITVDGDCSHEIKRWLILGRKDMINLESLLKSRAITLPTKVHIVKAMVFPVVMCRYEGWTIKKAERWIIDTFKLWC